jgi:hypothetical protein
MIRQLDADSGRSTISKPSGSIPSLDTSKDSVDCLTLVITAGHF